MTSQNGPKTYTITKTTCMGCSYMNSSLIKSGHNPVKEYYCKHPQSLSGESPHVVKLPWQKEKGALIGNSDETPLWCPYLNTPINKTNLEKILNEIHYGNSCIDKVIITNISFQNAKTTIDFDIQENRLGTLHNNSIKITDKNILVVLNERYEGGGDEEIIENAIKNIIKSSNEDVTNI